MESVDEYEKLKVCELNKTNSINLDYVICKSDREWLNMEYEKLKIYGNCKRDFEGFYNCTNFKYKED